MEACPLLARLLPLTGEVGVLGVALSGAGPGVLLVVEADAAIGELAARIRQLARRPGARDTGDLHRPRHECGADLSEI